MKNSIFKISTAIFLCCVLCFGATSASINLPQQQNQTSGGNYNPIQTNTLLDINEVLQPTANDTENYSVAPSQNDGEIIKPEDILPDTDNVTQVPDNSESTNDGVITVPAMLNNIMRDSLPTVITKKAYAFTVDRRGAVLYAFNHTESEEKLCLWYITLYEEYSPDGSGKTTDYRVLYRQSYDKIGKSVTSSAVGVLPGNYKVVVECVSGYTEDKYDIIIGYKETDSCEIEPNNSPERYTQLPLNKTLNGSASILPGDTPDVDYYLFKVTQKGYCVFYFNHEADNEAGNANNIGWRVSIEDMNGTEYYYITSDMKKAAINSGVMGLPEGYYILTVASHIFSGTAYTVNVSFTADNAIETELNDTAETANEIQVNTEKIGSLTARDKTSDRDYFVFDMKQDGFVVIDFIHEQLKDTQDGWRITVTDEKGAVAYRTVSDWSQPILQSPNIGLTAGKYFIKIDSDNLHHSSIVYRLILLTVESIGWETEPNNSIETADVITLEKSVSGTMIETGVDYDKDYFAFDIAENSTVNVTFSHVTTDEKDKEGWIVTLFDENSEKIESITSNWDSGEMKFTADIPAGKYYILVETGLYFNSARYVLTVANVNE